MRKFDTRIDDPHFQEVHHALGCPWPDEAMGETLPFESDIQTETVGLMLCKMVGKDLRLAEEVMFTNGRPAVLNVLQRANLTGHVGGSVDETTVFWADQLDTQGDTVGEIRLDRESWNKLKNHWMRCRMQPSN